MSANICVLIDFENIERGTRQVGYGRFDAAVLMNGLRRRGNVRIARAYADFTRYSDHCRDLLREGVASIQLSSSERGKLKNGADVALCVDGVSLAHTADYIDTYVIVSADVDFVPLLFKLRELGKTVWFGGVEEITSTLLVSCADEFISYGTLFRAAGGRMGPPEEDDERSRRRLTRRSRELEEEDNRSFRRDENRGERGYSDNRGNPNDGRYDNRGNREEFQEERGNREERGPREDRNNREERGVRDDRAGRDENRRDFQEPQRPESNEGRDQRGHRGGQRGNRYGRRDEPTREPEAETLPAAPETPPLELQTTPRLDEAEDMHRRRRRRRGGRRDEEQGGWQENQPNWQENQPNWQENQPHWQEAPPAEHAPAVDTQVEILEVPPENWSSSSVEAAPVPVEEPAAPEAPVVVPLSELDLSQPAGLRRVVGAVNALFSGRPVKFHEVWDYVQRQEPALSNLSGGFRQFTELAHAAVAAGLLQQSRDRRLGSGLVPLPPTEEVAAPAAVAPEATAPESAAPETVVSESAAPETAAPDAAAVDTAAPDAAAPAETPAPPETEAPPEAATEPSRLAPQARELLVAELEALGAKGRPVFASQLSQGIGKRIRGFRPRQWGFRTFGAILLELENEGLVILSSHPKSQDPMVELKG